VFFEDFLSLRASRRAPDGAFSCSCGRRHRINARRVIVSRGALSSFAELVSDCFGSGCRVWVLSDRNTEEAAGRALKKNLGAFDVQDVVLPGRPKPQPTLENVLDLERRVRESGPDLLVAVGGGTISDMVKKISLDTGVVNWCVPTCPSVDAYTSGTAAIWERGYHTSVASRGSELILCDIGVLESAPRKLILSGLGDLLGKFLAHLDWHVSHMITGEPICEGLLNLSLESVKGVFDAGACLGKDGEGTAGTLIDALLTSGLVMQGVGSSRPAGSAEHTIAHFWEMAKIVHDETLDLHGVLAGLAGTIVSRAYGDFYRRLERVRLDVAARAKVFREEPGWERRLESAVLPYKFKMVEEMEGKGLLDRKTLEDRLSRLVSFKDTIVETARQRLEELERAVAALVGIGFPSSPSDAGIRPEDALLPFRYVRYLRNRYSSFDLMYECGLEQEVLEALERSVSAAM
jgi:glycerol-1-phosphate dehydrogenase [NAD(P)+]